MNDLFKETPKEIRKGFEEAIRKNLKAVRDDNSITRDRCEKLSVEIKELKNLIISLTTKVQEQDVVINILRSQLYKGTTIL